MKLPYCITNIFFCILIILFFNSCTKPISFFKKTVPEKEKSISEPSIRRPDLPDQKRKKENDFSYEVTKGNASYYKKLPSMSPLTASGEPFDDKEMTAAHPHYPFGTRLKVTNSTNNKSVIVRVNDRGPFVEDRIIDISLAAAKKIGMLEDGVTEVEIKIISE